MMKVLFCEGKVLMCEGDSQEVLQITNKEFLYSESFFDYLHPNDVKFLKRAIEMKNRESGVLFRLQKDDCTYQWLQGTLSMVEEKERTLSMLQIFSQTKEPLFLLEMEMFIPSVSDLEPYEDAHGIQKSAVGDTFTKTFESIGVSEQEVKSKDMTAFMHHNEQQLADKSHARVFTGVDPNHAIRFRLLKRNAQGQEYHRWFECYAQYVPEKDENAPHYFAVHIPTNFLETESYEGNLAHRVKTLTSMVNMAEQNKEKLTENLDNRLSMVGDFSDFFKRQMQNSNNTEGSVDVVDQYRQMIPSLSQPFTLPSQPQQNYQQPQQQQIPQLKSQNNPFFSPENDQIVGFF
eukprot:Lithocolla_globosa_v1_NODE_5391_length_1245_cov_30.745805.p1 type:complete len:347 gc:universal NODE_5391_length_1245_cov_30.745805:1158-118(-)